VNKSNAKFLAASGLDNGKDPGMQNEGGLLLLQSCVFFKNEVYLY